MQNISFVVISLTTLMVMFFGIISITTIKTSTAKTKLEQFSTNSYKDADTKESKFTKEPTSKPTRRHPPTLAPTKPTREPTRKHSPIDEPTPSPTKPTFKPNQYLFPSTLQPTFQVGMTANDSSKPNIIFIMADDLGWNSMGYEDFDLDFATPFMSSMARQGVIMTNYYSQELCMPARSAFLTGRYPVNIGTQYDSTSPNSAWGLNISETLWPKSKWNIGYYSPRYLPTARGFDYYLGYLADAELYWSKRVASDTVFHDFMYASTECYAQYNGTDREKYSTFFYRDKAVRIIEEFDFEDGDPLLLYVAFQAVHDPFGDDTTYPNGIPKGYVDESMYDNIHANVTGRKRRQYAMALNVMDQAVDSIWSAVLARGQENNSYMIFASDNGGCYGAGGRNGPLRGTKGSLWEGGTKVDAWVYSPLLPTSVRGSQYGGLMHVTDWFPTLLELAGVGYTAKQGYALDGYSQVEAWGNESANERQYLLYNMIVNVDRHLFSMKNAPVAIRDSKFKLIHAYTDNPSSEWWSFDVGTDDDNTISVSQDCGQGFSMDGDFGYFLFDLEKDPYEENNLYFDESYAHVKTTLTNKLESIEKNSVSDISSSAKKPMAAYIAWKDAGNYISPWVKESSLYADDTSYPRPCSFSASVVSPDWPSDDDEPFLNETWAQRRSNDESR